MVVHEVLFNLGKLSLGVVAPLLEQIEVLGVDKCRVELLHGVLESALLLAVKAAIFEVVDGHKDASEVTDLGQFLRRDLLSLTLELVLLVLNSLKALLQLCNVIIQLHNLSLHVLLISGNCLLEFFQLTLKLLHPLIKLGV